MAARIGVAMVAVAFLAMAPLDAGATRYTFVNTQYGRGDTSDLYHYDGTSVSITWDDSNAADIRHSTAFADFGVLKVTGETSMLGAGASGGSAYANAEWLDNVVFTNASLTGQGGTATVVLSVAGSLVQNPVDNVRNLGAYASLVVQKNTADGGWWRWQRAQAGPVGTDPDRVIGSFSIDIPIVFGERFDLMVSLGGASEIHATSYADRATGTAKADLGNSLYWGGVTQVSDSNGNPVTYSVSSESGHNWALSSVPGAAVAGDNRATDGGSCSVAPGCGTDALSGTVGLLTLLSPAAWLWAARRRGRRNR